MGAEAEHPQQQQPPSSLRPGREEAAAAAAPAVLGLQLSALIDHVARVNWSLLDRVPGDRGSSQQANEFRKEDFKGSKWLVVRYAQQNMEQIIEAIRIAKQEGLSVSLDLASFEMVRDSRSKLINLLEIGNIDLCFANEDEAREGRSDIRSRGGACILGQVLQIGRGDTCFKGVYGETWQTGEVVQVPAIGESNSVDTTGAGDLFASGFLYGLVKGLPLEECCKVGACSGGSVTRALVGEVRPENWQWMYKQMHARGLLLLELKN
ncbi:ribokinase [Panicum miliaceum]|uniref:Ribokinase n=1 Tax=Panicum miliaceum TaxID=4540 RepID=A0A3L6S6W4_PANMI|nr:ribokinase [Panicum miliaceum]